MCVELLHSAADGVVIVVVGGGVKQDPKQLLYIDVAGSLFSGVFFLSFSSRTKLGPETVHLILTHKFG